MAKIVDEYDYIRTTVLRQLRLYWDDIDEQIIDNALPNAFKKVEKTFCQLPDKRFCDGNNVLFSPYMSVQWMIFLYWLSHEIYYTGGYARERIRFIILIKSCTPLTGFMP